MPTELAKQDITILRILQRDASKTSSEIAETLNMSQSPCWRRINRIEQAGIVRKKVAILDREKLGMELVVFTTVNLSITGRQQLEEFESSVSDFPEVVECYTMTGVWDYMLKIITRDIRHYESFVRERLLSLPMIGETHSHIAVTEIKNTTELPLETQL
ncbi:MULTISPECIES: Lrp/AsnC family transcriptional regulator [Spongiibacter]|jgi:Lrp/AsnC family transcriptional regulator|uniref:Lrp/AsnC family transcriptional regulator n=1 Tax=Spongiibacter TaxID=630749 RepID=UPI000C0AFD81|nr:MULTISPECIES: Lrp/AsnC family transcriptional regulator [Spongiibacter]MAK45626.1 AsnC family transcriptional regulator [Spongiibacter sp.]MBM7424232.1 Lrp/AsnC family transcriptional regulator [Spongiibacter marinus]MEE2653566.1 Lrp/AsnC family transcriptional regulator [Pseudomonadota bacterium]|tara:strand:+ start:482 stop:958 length:477 start_codon:yes stop_codon:yes gene_type:complete